MPALYPADVRSITLIMANDHQADIDAVQSIAAVSTILDVVCRTTGMGFAAVARVTDTRWICCAVKDDIRFGLRPGGELEVGTTICNEIRQHRESVAIDHVAHDGVYRNHPTPAAYGFQSYISVPILLKDGSIFGTLCAIDPKPARLDNPQTIATLELFAQLIGFHLDVRDRLASSEASLLDERKTAELREQFIAVLGHDLRNPLASIDAGAKLLLKTPLNERAVGLVTIMQSSIVRMSGLIDNVLDFARGRLGGGLPIDRTTAQPLLPVLEHVVAEFRTSQPDRWIEAAFSIHRPIRCDRDKIGQLFSNLLGNALAYGSAASPVSVRAVTDPDVFELSVANAGQAIPPETIERLFAPFSRGTDRQSNLKGLGLGLYIASEVARAHGGRIDVTSTPAETRFTFRMPLSEREAVR
jgi:signal transduction histidine kinase